MSLRVPLYHGSAIRGRLPAGSVVTGLETQLAARVRPPVTPGQKQYLRAGRRAAITHLNRDTDPIHNRNHPQSLANVAAIARPHP
jgi:hypothetical protein